MQGNFSDSVSVRLVTFDLVSEYCICSLDRAQFLPVCWSPSHRPHAAAGQACVAGLQVPAADPAAGPRTTPACRSCARIVAVSACRAGPRRSCSARRFPARGGDSHASRPAFLGKGRGAAPAQILHACRIMHPESHPIAALLGENAI